MMELRDSVLAKMQKLIARREELNQQTQAITDQIKLLRSTIAEIDRNRRTPLSVAKNEHQRMIAKGYLYYGWNVWRRLERLFSATEFEWAPVFAVAVLFINGRFLRHSNKRIYFTQDDVTAVAAKIAAFLRQAAPDITERAAELFFVRGSGKRIDKKRRDFLIEYGFIEPNPAIWVEKPK